jgi:hypothetical protein
MAKTLVLIQLRTSLEVVIVVVPSGAGFGFGATCWLGNDNLLSLGNKKIPGQLSTQ